MSGFLTDSGLPMILATALVQSLRMSDATTASTGTLVLRFNVGISSFRLFAWFFSEVERGDRRAQVHCTASRRNRLMDKIRQPIGVGGGHYNNESGRRGLEQT